jgi:hypothetical protein
MFFSIFSFFTILLIMLDRLCLRSGTMTEARDASVNAAWASTWSVSFFSCLIFFLFLTILTYSQCVITIPPRNGRKGPRMPAPTWTGSEGQVRGGRWWRGSRYDASRHTVCFFLLNLVLIFTNGKKGRPKSPNDVKTGSMIVPGMSNSHHHPNGMTNGRL